MQQTERKREDGRRLWWGIVNQECKLRVGDQPPHPVICMHISWYYRKRERVKQEGTERNQRHPTMWNRRLINFRPLMSDALPGQAASSQSPRLHSGSCHTLQFTLPHLCQGLNDTGAVNSPHFLSLFPSRLLSPINVFLLFTSAPAHKRVIKSNTLSEALLKRAHWSPVASLTPGVLCL